MASSLLAAALCLSSLPLVLSFQNYERSSGILQLPVIATNLTELQLISRQDVIPTVNTQTGTLYVVSFYIGTPPQLVSVALDTGSSDVWVDPTCSAAGSASSIALCNTYTKYTPGLSTTAVNTGIPMDLYYGLGEAHGTYYKDTFSLGGASIVGQQFGVSATSTSLRTGLMGVGPGIELTGYKTLVDQLADQNVINSRAFSLDLRSNDSPSGAIIFGGIDTGKYSGALEKRPIIPAAQAPDGFDRYWIYMTSVGITKPGASPKLYAPSSTNANGQAVFLDSGGTLSRLPTPLFNAIVADFPEATLDAGSGLYIVPCTVSSQLGTVDFGFGATTIHVSYNDFIWRAGTNLCVLGIAAEDDAPVLGDSFLRAAFVVYDQDNKNLLLANAADCGTNLVAIGSGPNAVPSLVGNCGSVSTTSSSSSSTATTSTSGTSSTQSSTITSSVTSSSSTATASSATSSTAETKSSTITSSFTSSITSSSSSSVVSSKSSSSSSSTALTSSVSSTISKTSSTTSNSASTSSTSSSLSTSSVSSFTRYTNSSTTSIAPSTSSSSIPTTILTTLSSTTTSASTVTSSSIAPSLSLSTVYTTKVYTITSCAPVVTNCPYGSLTTETISLYTTYCPITPAVAIPTTAAVPTTNYKKSTTSTVYATKTFTVTSCAPTVTNCPLGKLTTSTYALYTTVCPVADITTPLAPVYVGKSTLKSGVAAVTTVKPAVVVTTVVGGVTTIVPVVLAPSKVGSPITIETQPGPATYPSGTGVASPKFTAGAGHNDIKYGFVIFAVVVAVLL